MLINNDHKKGTGVSVNKVNTVVLKEVMEDANKMEKCKKNKSINFSQIVLILHTAL